MSDQKQFTRRQFVRAAALGSAAAGALTVPAMAAGRRADECPDTGIPETWDMEADVVIVGYGGAGACAAIAVADKGLKPLVLEKAPKGEEGGNTAVCCGGMLVPAPEDAEIAVDYYRNLGFGTVTDEELIAAFAKALAEIPGKLADMGVPILTTDAGLYFPALGGDLKKLTANFIDEGGGTGEAMFKALSAMVEERGVEVMFETPGTALVQNPATREILGVMAEKDSKAIAVKAKRAVVLACGGYENNPQMQMDHNYPGLFAYPWGTPYNTGEGLKMAADAGAEIWHMTSLEWAPLCYKEASDYAGCALSSMAYTEAGNYIYVNRYGQRFMDELLGLGHLKSPLALTYFDHNKAEYPNLPCYMVFDETRRTAGPLSPKTAAYGRLATFSQVHKKYVWSEDNSAEIEKGWIVKADTIKELAELKGIDPAALEETVAKYNEYCKAGEDPDFGRKAEALLPIETGPFYLVEMALSCINTQGGPKHDAKSRVLDHKDQPIPRLYAAGELGSFFGFLYQGANNFPEALAFGFIAGENAAAEEPVA